MFILFSGAVLFTACNKNNTVKPNSKAVPTIIPEVLGTYVASDGGVLFITNTIPAATFGDIGNYVLDVINGIVYGPKTTSGWGTGLSLKGKQGPTGTTGTAGAPGSKIYAGSGAPATTLGIVGDYYLDRHNIMLYGPKTANGWGVPVNLRGPKGPAGPAGPTGPIGGNYNVKTDTFTVAGSSWLWNSQYLYETSTGSYTEYFTRYYVRKNNTVTQDVLNNGSVLVYFTPSPTYNPAQWEPLPYQFDSSFGYTYNYVFVTAVGQVTLHYFFIQTDPSATLPTLSTYNDETRRFKIVTILGEMGTFMAANHINVNNYEDVAKVTGLWQQDASGNK